MNNHNESANEVNLKEGKDVFTITNDGFKDKEEEPASFESAISATGFGKFNILLIMVAIPAGFTSIFETTTMSYVFPAAQCDLNLTLENKGMLNAATYIGTISSAFIWGFLCDTWGRKNLLVIGFFLDTIFVLIGASSQSFVLLAVAKFFGGFVMNGPFAALTTLLSEFHSSKYRAKIQMALGIIFSTASMILPILAWLVLPTEIYVSFMNGLFEIHSWNVFLAISATPAILGGISFIFFPESPKFLMTKGRNAQALEVFKTVYWLNTGKPKDTFPIKYLIDENELKNRETKQTQNKKTSTFNAIKGGFVNLKPLFFPPYLSKIILVCVMQMLFMMSLNTLRLWLPQIFQAVNDYQHLHNGSSATLCTMLEVIRPNKSAIVNDTCLVNLENSQVYINSIVVAATTIFGYSVVAALINILGKNKILGVCGVGAGAFCMALYFAQDSVSTLILSSIFIGLASICVNVVLAVVVNIFPTTLRTMTVSLTMMVGRSGAMLGNLIFPILLQTGCAPPFFTMGSVIIGCAFLSLLLPNTDMKALV